MKGSLQSVDYLASVRKIKQKTTVVHYHNVNELYFLVDGKSKWFINDDVYIIEPGEFVFAYKGDIHNTEFMAQSTLGFLLNFDDDFLEPEYHEYLNILRQQRRIRVSSKKLPEFYDILNKLVLEDKNKSEYHEKIRQLYLRLLLTLIFAYKRDSVPTEFNFSYETVRDAMKYIRDNVCEDLSLNTLAKKYAFSPSYFSRLFKEVTSIGVNEYINISRILKAQQLLSESKIPITEVSEKCGYNDSNYFIYMFKKITGETPKKYSKKFEK